MKQKDRDEIEKLKSKIKGLEDVETNDLIDFISFLNLQ